MRILDFSGSVTVAVSILCMYCGKRFAIDDSTSTVGLYMDTAFEDELGDELTDLEKV